MATPLHHTWTYQALAHDVLQYSLNRVSINESDQGTGARRKTRVCDLDSKDQFWMNHKGSPFPLVAEKIEEELEDYRSKEEDIKRMKSDMGLESGNENDAAIGLLSDNTQVILFFYLFMRNKNPDYFQSKNGRKKYILEKLGCFFSFSVN